jgi:hypothetical protein
VTLTAAQRTIVGQQQARRRRVAITPTPRKTVRRFTVWCGSSIGRQYQTIEQLAARVLDLLPTGVWDELELLMKAGEGGTWQSAFDPHPLALSGSWTLANHIADARSIGVRITPYVVVRGRPAWLADEQAQIRACVTVAGRCVLNVEPGAPYYNGPNDPTYIRGYLRGIAVPADALEVCAIPRATQVAELGGVACIQAWTDPQFVGSASWETYDARRSRGSTAGACRLARSTASASCSRVVSALGPRPSGAVRAWRCGSLMATDVRAAA